MTQDDVDALNATLVRGLEQGDAGLIASIYAPGAQLLPPGMEAVTGAAIEEVWKGAIGQGVRGGRLETLSLDERDDMAVEVGRYQLLTGPDGDVLDHGKYVVVHRRQSDGSWRLGIDIWNSSTPAT